jgi:hypothetical protein
MSLWVGKQLTRKTINKDPFVLESTDYLAIRFAFLKSCGINDEIKFYEIYKWEN